MNLLLKVHPPPTAAKIAHSVMAYDRATEELDLELPIPLFFDTLALKIARVPPEGKYGALSYPLEARAVDTFGFLLGLDVDMSKREYFLRTRADSCGRLSMSGSDPPRTRDGGAWQTWPRLD
jgi:hypothetical protein